MIDALIAAFFQLAAGAPAHAAAQTSSTGQATGAASSEDWYNDASGESDDDAPASQPASAAAAATAVSGVTVPGPQQQTCVQRPVVGSRVHQNVCTTAAQDATRQDAAMQGIEDLQRLRDAITISEAAAAAGGR